jgi:hypothetical protein
MLIWGWVVGGRWGRGVGWVLRFGIKAGRVVD